jgi:hypothetical protein
MMQVASAATSNSTSRKRSPGTRITLPAARAACGLCHTDKTIDWTLGYLKAWYGKTYSEAQIAANYPNRDAPAAIGWLASENEAVRLAATDAVARQKDTGALPALIDTLDDPFLLNRQFARIALEDWLSVRLADYGYRFYMAPQERREPIERLRRALLRDVEARRQLKD